MSIHRSLRGVDTLRGERSVFKRIERIQILKKEGRFDSEEEGRSVYGLPKVRTKFKVMKKKKGKETAKADDAPAADAEAEAES